MGTDLLERASHARFQFLSADLAMCLTFVELADTELKLGEPDAAARALGSAQKGLATLQRFLASPLHTNRLTDAQILELTTGVAALEKRVQRAARDVNASSRK